jgi:hypothetical protein
MLLKTIQITIPKNKILQDISSFSPEENYLMLKIGSDCLLEGRKVITGLSQDEIYEKIKNETKEEIQKLELDIIVEREMSKKMEDRYAKMYESQLDQMKKQIETMDKQIKSYECENADIISKEIEKIREKCNAIIEEKEKQNQLNREVFDKALKVSQISNAEKGSKGELKFNDIADTFKDYNKFYLEDKHTQSGQGDFHLHFDEFTVLADAKNYYNKVDKTQRDKIKKDLSVIIYRFKQNVETLLAESESDVNSAPPPVPTNPPPSSPLSQQRPNVKLLTGPKPFASAQPKV